MLEVSQTNEGWLSQFFSGRNNLRWDELKSNATPDEWASEVAGWLSILEQEDKGAPICLPCSASDGSVEWYAGARTLQGSHALADELQAFVGPSFSGFDIRPQILDPGDPQEAALQGIFVGSAFKIVGRTEKEAANLRRAFSLFRALVQRRPATLRATTRPFGIVRGLFDRALAAGNQTEARLLLEEMQRSGRLTSENLKFLEVRLLAGLGLWDQIVLESNLLRDLTDFPLPPRVVRDVSEAFYRFYVGAFDAEGGLEACLERLRQSSLMRLDKLFSQRHNIQHSSVIKVFLLRELLRRPVDQSYAFVLLNEIEEHDRSVLVQEIEASLKSEDLGDVGSDDLRRKADEAFLDGEYDRALALYQQVTAEPSSIKRMVACARLAGDEESARSVLDFVGALSKDLISSLDKGALEKLEALESQARPIPTEKPVPPGKGVAATQSLTEWLGWARWVANGAERDQAINALRQHVEEWSVARLRSNPPQIEEFANIIGNASGASEAVFREAFDGIFSAFVLDLEEPTEDLKPLYRNLLFLLATSEALSKNDLSISAQLVSSLLSLGLTTDEYEDVIEQVLYLFETHGALNSLDWALDVAEVLVVERCRDKEARLRFFTTVTAFAQQSAHRLSNSQRCAFEALHRDFSMEVPDVLKAEEESEQEFSDKEIAVRLAGKKIGIYTLTEPAGKRAADALMKLAPESEIHLNCDHECTERLSALASSADIFVFAWKSSKHQAYYCVKNHRPSELPLLQPLGKGSASIIREVLEFA